MDSYDMRTMEQTSRILEKIADFAGNLIMQLLQKQDYVEAQGVKALLDHVREGGATRTVVVSDHLAEEFKELMKEGHVPFVEIEHVDPVTKERDLIFVYRHSDQAEMKKVMERFEQIIDKASHEVDLETFESVVGKGGSYGRVEHLSRTELYAFREAAKEYHIFYSVVSTGDGYGIVADDSAVLGQVIADLCYNLSGERGRAYEILLGDWLLQQRDFVEQARPESGKVKYIVNARNPENFISIDEQGITTHSVGIRMEPQPDGSSKRILYDCRHVTYPGFDAERLKTLADELYCPVILSEEEFTLVQGISKTKEAILAEDLVEQFKPFVEEMKGRKADLSRMPVRKPLYERENLIGLYNLPAYAIHRIAELEIPDVYFNGNDLAYPKELKEHFDEMLDELLYQGMTPEEKAEAMQVFECGEENRAIDYMLGIERAERSVLHAGKNLNAEFLNETQKEAYERMRKREVKEQTMNREEAQKLKNLEIDRRMGQDPDR